MNWKRFIPIFLLMVVVGLVVGQPAAYGQTLPSTTLSTAITDSNTTNLVVLASVGSGTSAVIAGNIIFMDGEAMTVKTTPTTTTVSVIRHTLATPGQTHAANTVVFYGPSTAFVSGKPGGQFYQGQCTASAYLTLPVVDVVNVTVGTCTNSQWRWSRLTAPYGTLRPYTPVNNVSYTALVTDEVIGVTTLTTGVTITLPAATGLAGKYFVIQDESGNAGTQTATITLSVTPNGTNTTNTILTGFGFIVLRSNGTKWMKQ